MVRRPLIIDCDPGVDDAVALLLAFASTDAFDLRALTTVAGNVTVDLATRNALCVRDIAGRGDVPVFAGASCPLHCPLCTAPEVHGAGGLGGLDLPTPSAGPDSGHAADALVHQISKAAEPVTLAVLGPQTNIALALERAPSIRSAVAEIVFMGGSAGPGNVTPHAEFNMHVDPHAAAAVLASGIPVTMVGLDVTRQVRVTEQRLARIGTIDTPLARFAASILAPYAARGRPDGAPLHDPCVIAYLLAPELFRSEPACLAVECGPSERLGETRVTPVAGGVRTTARILREVDVDGIFALLVDRLGRADGAANPSDDACAPTRALSG